MIELSVVIPVYNGALHIKQCLMSLSSAIKENVEVIVVDDGSSDDTCRIIEENFSSIIDSGNLRLLKQKNSGVSSARNNGIKLSRGRYIAFVDADDFVAEEYFSSLLRIINSEAPDIIEFGWTNLKDNVESTALYVHQSFGLYSVKSNLKDIYSASIWYPWLRVIKKSLIQDSFFPVGVRFCEDMMAFSALYNDVSFAYQLKKPLYIYRSNECGATANISPDYISSMLGFYDQIIERKEMHYDLLKISIFYVLFRCSNALRQDLHVSVRVFEDLKRIRANFYKYKSVGFRRLKVLFFPKTKIVVVE